MYSLCSNLLRRLQEALPGLADDQQKHCRWMISTVVAQTEWPPDKRLRWLGFVASVTDGSGCSLQAFGRWRDAALMQSCGALVEPVLVNVHREVLAGLPVPSDPTAADLRAACEECPTAAGMAFGVGYLQGVLVSRGLLDVEEERARTRPLFHEAYRQCGWTVPETVSPLEGSVGKKAKRKSAVGGRI